MSENETASKKPIYKKWWFWLIVVIIILAIAGGSATNNSNESKTTLTSGDANISTSNSSNSSSSETTSKIYNVGEIFENDNIAIKYVSVDENFTGYNQYATIKDGCKIVKADFEFENVGSSDQYVSAYEFGCYADGYDCEAFWSVEDSGFSSTLSSGKKAKGSVYFQVPTDATSITIEYTLNSFTSENVEFLVK